MRDLKVMQDKQFIQVILSSTFHVGFAGNAANISYLAVQMCCMLVIQAMTQANKAIQFVQIIQIMQSYI